MEECKKSGIQYVEMPVAFDALTVVVNPKNNWANTLTVAELKKIWEPDAQGAVGADVAAILGRWYRNLALYGAVAAVAALTLLAVSWLALRRARVSSTAVLGVQTVVLALFSLGLSLGAPGFAGTWYQQYSQLWVAGIEHMRTQASPMDPNDGVRLIFVTVVGVIMIMTVTIPTPIETGRTADSGSPTEPSGASEAT